MESHILAQAAGDTMSGEYAIRLIVAILVALGGGLGTYHIGRRRALAVRVADQPVEVSERKPAPNWAEFSGLSRRVENMERHMDELRDQQGRQYRDLLQAGHDRELRIMAALATMKDAIADQITDGLNVVHRRVDGLPRKP